MITQILNTDYTDKTRRGPARRSFSVGGFTLIELLISITIAGLITAATYFSLDTALDSWGYSQDSLALQKVISETMDDVINGVPGAYGLRDSLEIVTAGLDRIEFIAPWTDDTHSVANEDFVYQLNRKVKPGTGVPIGEIKLPESNKYYIIPVKILDLEDSTISQVKLGIAAPLGSDLRFTYQPDSEGAGVNRELWWDSDVQHVYFEDIDGVENLSRNPFGVKVSKVQFRYYDNTNNLINDRDWVEDRDLNMITGIEVYMEAELEGGKSQSLINFVNLRNAPMRSGYLPLRQGVRIPVSNSKDIHTLLLTNISGVSSGDELELEFEPEVGKAWRINLKFEHVGLSKSTIDSYTIEYPHAHPLHTEYSRSNVEDGLDLLTVGPNGLYDYDDDNDIKDFVNLEGKVMLNVVKMDIEGAGLFLRP